MSISKNLLLVEGPDDKHVILNLQGERVKNCNIDRAIDKERIQECIGIDSLLKALPVRIKSGNFDIVGAVLDADTNLAGRWQSIQVKILDLGYSEIPKAPDPNGTIIPAPEESNLPKVGIWLMPDNSTNGILEDFLRFLIPENDRLWPYANQVVDALPETRFSELASPKARMHTWLAWQEEPGRPLGQAITARYLDPNVKEAQRFLDWLFALFG